MVFTYSIEVSISYIYWWFLPSRRWRNPSLVNSAVALIHLIFVSQIHGWFWFKPLLAIIRVFRWTVCISSEGVTHICWIFSLWPRNDIQKLSLRLILLVLLLWLNIHGVPCVSNVFQLILKSFIFGPELRVFISEEIYLDLLFVLLEVGLFYVVTHFGHEGLQFPRLVIDCGFIDLWDSVWAIVRFSSLNRFDATDLR